MEVPKVLVDASDALVISEGVSVEQYSVATVSIVPASKTISWKNIVFSVEHVDPFGVTITVTVTLDEKSVAFKVNCSLSVVYNEGPTNHAIVSSFSTPPTVNTTDSFSHKIVLLAAAVKDKSCIGWIILIVTETTVDVQLPEVTNNKTFSSLINSPWFF